MSTIINNKSLLLLPPLEGTAREFWPAANKHVLWGWKRDVGYNSRIVYYSAWLEETGEGIVAKDNFFFYKHRTVTTAAETLYEQLYSARENITELLGLSHLRLESSKVDDHNTVLFQVGEPKREDKDRIKRLQMRHPRKHVARTVPPKETDFLDLLHYLPADLYAGSGVSYEAGLPTMRGMHDYFCLDDHEGGTFTVGNNDLLPLWLLTNPKETFQNFCKVHTMAITAAPTPAQEIIASLHRGGIINKIYSDNVDNLLSKVGIQFERTRGSGVFNERFDTQFSEEVKSLLVVGVAADRREIIQQGRKQKKKIIVVNPCLQVAPCVQHMNYAREGDLFYKMTAHMFFKRLWAAVGERELAG